jgi:hypothetical protein
MKLGFQNYAVIIPIENSYTAHWTLVLGIMGVFLGQIFVWIFIFPD